jgi:phage terminase large subunit GpA-like protein
MTAPPGDIGLLRLLAAGIRPDPRRSVAEWAEAERVVSEGAYEGRWRNARAPYLVEIMERMSLYCPTRRVTLLASAQIGKTQCGLNMAGQILTETPAQVLVVLPSLNSLRMYNRDKLDRMIQGTPALANAVADVTERSGVGSTTAVKRGARGAQIELVTASSSRDLQSRTARAVIMEEVSEYEADVGGRGDPVEQAEARTIQWQLPHHCGLGSWLARGLPGALPALWHAPGAALPEPELDGGPAADRALHLRGGGLRHRGIEQGGHAG